MSNFLTHPVTTIAFCWRISRRDGVRLGFTTHDRDLVIGHLTYSAAPGMLPSAVVLTDGFDADSMDISGALTSASISEDDLGAGRWDGARVRLFMVDWADPAAEQLFLARGELGSVSLEGEGFTAELRGPTALLDGPVSELTSPDCRAELGDTRCRIDLAPLTRVTEVVSLLDEVTIDVGEAAAGVNAYGYGTLRWLTGRNSGLRVQILRSSGARLTLREPVYHTVSVDDKIEITEGCNKLFRICNSRFTNSVNFRGEPHLPGNDLLTRYPGAG